MRGFYAGKLTFVTLTVSQTFGKRLKNAEPLEKISGKEPNPSRVI